MTLTPSSTPSFTATISGPATPTAENLARTHLGEFVQKHPGFSATVTQSTGNTFNIPAQGTAPSYADLLQQVATLQKQLTGAITANPVGPAQPAEPVIDKSATVG